MKVAVDLKQVDKFSQIMFVSGLSRHLYLYFIQETLESGNLSYIQSSTLFSIYNKYNLI